MDKLGINSWLLLFQMINFSIIVVLLDKLVFVPLAKKMAERKKLIERGLAVEGEAQQKLTEIETERKKQIELAKGEMEKMAAETIKEANKLKEEIVANAKKEAEGVVAKAKKQIELEREEMMVGAKEEVAQMAMGVVESIMGNNPEITKQFNKKAIDKLWQKK